MTYSRTVSPHHFLSLSPPLFLTEGCVIEPGCILAPGTVLLPDTLVPKAQLWAGNPAQYIRDVTEEEIEKTAAVGLPAICLRLVDNVCHCCLVWMQGTKLS